ncbi:hypothetical protein [Terriglobus sp. RCC_193]|uniref:hypothetical protein n=1 Tax=Terriglobus sp. RCC_193 TaxID=3239218 RepID=UPI0035231222
MEIALITEASVVQIDFSSPTTALFWRYWRETRGRFAAALVLLAALVSYAVASSPSFLARYNTRFPDKPLAYSAYVWSGLFHYALQGLWILGAFVLTLGGLSRETASGAGLFTLGLPMKKAHVFLVRACITCLEAIVLGVLPAVLISVSSGLVGQTYPLSQALFFGGVMGVAGLVVVTFGLLLSEIFTGEFTAAVVGLCLLSVVFLSYKAHTLKGWNVFEVMSATASIDPISQLSNWSVPWLGLTACCGASAVLLWVTCQLVKRREA